jgi:hypothetical protein
LPTDLLWEGQSYVIGEERGLEQGQRSIVSIILDRKLGKLPAKTAIALLEFRTIDDLKAWLKDS